jgi:hypothetical protein
MKNSRCFLPVPLFALLSVFLFSVSVSAQKLSAEEIVAKHLEAIGSAESRKNLKNHVANGLVKFSVLRQAGVGGDGKIVLASEGTKSLLGMTFNIPTYPSELIVFDGKKHKVAFAINNARSTFGDYIYRYSETLKEGLLGGTLSTGWSLKNLSERKAKVKLEGTKKINDREAYALSYQPKGGSDLTITIFIDKETFQHVRTEYRRLISAMQGSSPDASALQRRERRENMIEEFLDYKTVNGLNLPHKYRIYLMLESDSSGTREYEWNAEFREFFINQPLDPASFSTEGK